MEPISGMVAIFPGGNLEKCEVSKGCRIWNPRIFVGSGNHSAGKSRVTHFLDIGVNCLFGNRPTHIHFLLLGCRLETVGDRELVTLEDSEIFSNSPFIIKHNIEANRL